MGYNYDLLINNYDSVKTAELIKKRHKKNLENKYGSAKTEKDNEGGEDNA